MRTAPKKKPTIITVRPEAAYTARQKIPIFSGISDKTAGSSGLSLYRIEIPPGGQGEPHLHRGFETAIYLLQGRVETRYGEGLTESVVNEAGDFVYIPADLPHQPINVGEEPAIAIVARNEASEQENVVPYEKMVKT